MAPFRQLSKQAYVKQLFPKHTNLAVLTVLVIALPLAKATSRRSLGPGFVRIWSDEFEPCQDSSTCRNGLNTSVWSFEEGDGTKYGPYLNGWGNNEVQCYTSSRDNARVVNTSSGARGVLVIEARFHENGMNCINPGSPSSTRWWSSARLITRNKVAFGGEDVPIKIEARLKIPAEWGAWPAFWMLPDTHRVDCLACGAYGDGWCTSGEIDIMEASNRGGRFQSTIHYGGLRSANWLDCKESTAIAPFNASSYVPYWNRVSVVMSPNNITFYINDTLIFTVNQAQWYTGVVDKAANPRAPFDRPFYMLLNLAVGGNKVVSQTNGALITDTRRAPYRFLVDYVRTYRYVQS